MDQQRPVLVAEASPAQLASAAAPVAPAEGWIVQVGAAPTEQGAKSLISDAATRINGLDAFRPLVERFEKNGQIFFRARFAGFAGRDDATGMCGELKRVKMSCLAMRS